jgi:hypothetical protein
MLPAMDAQQPRRSWPRVTLILPPEARDTLHELARDNFRAPRAEALRLLLDAIERERIAASSRR